MKFQSRGIQREFSEDEMEEIKDLLSEDDFDLNGKVLHLILALSFGFRYFELL